MGKAPAFQFYAADWLADAEVRAMTVAERGLYIDLLAYAWREGSIPDDPDQLARMVGWQPHAPAIDFEAIWARVRMRFIARVDGRLVNSRMEKDRQEQEKFHKSKSRAGLAGATARWQPHAPANAIAMANDGSASASASASAETPEVNDQLPLDTHTVPLPADRPRHRARVPGGFDEFWEGWPWKRNRKAAERAFSDLNPDRAQLEAMKAGIARYAASTTVQRGAILHASTWIRNRRWEDADEPMGTIKLWLEQGGKS